MTREQQKVRAMLRALIRAPRNYFPTEGESLKVPDHQGVYVIYDRADRVVHVGNTIRGKRGLYQRLRNHLHGASSFTIKFLKSNPSKLRRGYSFRYLEVNAPRLRALVQAYAIGMLCPAHIGEGVLKRGGKS